MDTVPVFQKLRDYFPREIAEYYAGTWREKFLDREIVKEYSMCAADWETSYVRWPGPQKNVYYWVVLASGHAVGHNENPATGWSFPIVSYKVPA